MKIKIYLKYILIILTVVFLNSSNKIYAQNVDELYKKIDLFSEVLEKIQKEYVEEIDQFFCIIYLHFLNKLHY